MPVVGGTVAVVAVLVVIRRLTALTMPPQLIAMSPARDIPLRRMRLRPRGDTFADRLMTVRRRWRLLVRLSLATSLAYFIATEVLDHRQAFFAPDRRDHRADLRRRRRAVRTVVRAGARRGDRRPRRRAADPGHRPRGLADGLVVALAVVVGTLLGLTGLALTQAATSSVLLAAVIPFAGTGNPAVTRFLDALVGGLVGLAMVLLIPRNPVRDIDREVQRFLTRLGGDPHADRRRRCATEDADLADRALADARNMQPLVDSMTATASNVTEIARISPLRWRQRAHVQLYMATVIDLDNAVRDARVLARKTSALLRHGEQVPADMALAIDALAGRSASSPTTSPSRMTSRRPAASSSRLPNGVGGAARRGDDEQRLDRRAGAVARRRPAVRERLHP